MNHENALLSTLHHKTFLSSAASLTSSYLAEGGKLFITLLGHIFLVYNVFPSTSLLSITYFFSFGHVFSFFSILTSFSLSFNTFFLSQTNNRFFSCTTSLFSNTILTQNIILISTLYSNIILAQRIIISKYIHIHYITFQH